MGCLSTPAQLAGCMLSDMTDGAAYLQQLVRRRVDAEGLHPLARRTGLPIGQIRSIYQGRAPLLTTVSRVCAALGYELTIRPVSELREAASAPLRSASDLSPGTRETDPASPPPPPGVAPEPVPDRHIAEVLAVLADTYDDLDESGRALLLAHFWATHPALRESGGSRGSSGRRRAPPGAARGGHPQVERIRIHRPQRDRSGGGQAAVGARDGVGSRPPEDADALRVMRSVATI